MPQTYAVLFKRSAELELKKLPSTEVQRIVDTIQTLGSNPRPAGSIKLHGQKAYRVRRGDHRILYTIDDALKRVEIIKIGHRSEVYR